MTEDLGREALACIDAVLAKKPHKDGDALTHATAYLTALRERLAPADRAGASPAERERLVRLNGILTVVVSTHFPLGDPPWEELEKARDWLSQLLNDVHASA